MDQTNGHRFVTPQTERSGKRDAVTAKEIGLLSKGERGIPIFEHHEIPGGTQIDRTRNPHFETLTVAKDTRHVITSALAAVPEPPRRTHKKRPCIDTW